MKIPRNLDGKDLVRALRKLGYEPVRQDGSHVRLTTQRDGEHHVTIPAHSPLKVGTLNGILKLLGAHHGMSVADLLVFLDL